MLEHCAVLNFRDTVQRVSFVLHVMFNWHCTLVCLLIRIYIHTGMPYLDVIQRLRTASALPIAAYHVSGEYAMMKAAAQKVQ